MSFDFAQDSNFQPWFEADDHAAAEQLVDNADVAAALADDKPDTETKVDESTLQPKGFAARFCQPEDSGPPLQDETAESLKYSYCTPSYRILQLRKLVTSTLVRLMSN